MRILMVNHEFTISGASQIFFQLARHLQQQGHHIALLPCNPQDGPMQQRYLERGIEIAANIHTNDFDLAIANTICTAPYVLQLAPHLPVLWYVHEAEVALRLILNNPGWHDAFAAAKAVVYNMPFQNDVFRSFTYKQDPGKFHVIPFGVEIDTSTIDRSTLPPKTNRPRLVQVGTIEPRKRPGDVIRAVANCPQDIECVLAGRLVHLDDGARALVQANPDRYRIVEDATDGQILAWLESADMVSLASASETQGLAAYEAALLARPLILTDLLCYRGVFSHGVNCLMAPVGAVDMLSLAMSNLAASPELRRRLGLQAQQSARRYTRASFFSRFDQVIADTRSTSLPSMSA